METSSVQSVIDSKQYIKKTSLYPTARWKSVDCISLGKLIKINLSVRSVDCRDTARYGPMEFQVKCNISLCVLLMILHVHHDRFHSFVMESFNITEVVYQWVLVDMFHDIRGHIDPKSLFK